MTEKFHSINNPYHYTTHPSKIESIEIAKFFPFCLGSAFKYIFRRNKKNNKDRDLQKSYWFLQKELEITKNSDTFLLNKLVRLFYKYILKYNKTKSLINKVIRFEVYPYNKILLCIWKARYKIEPVKNLELALKYLKKELIANNLFEDME